jgi:hypothetical protein
VHHEESKVSTLLYKLSTHSTKELPSKSFTMDPNGMVRMLKMKLTKSPLASAKIIFFCDLLCTTLISILLLPLVQGTTLTADEDWLGRLFLFSELLVRIVFVRGS